MTGLSAVVITKNEERHIRDCLDSIAFADERVVVDSGSGDQTVRIAVSCSAKVVEHPFEDFASQKNFAAAQAKGPWILVIDADERVSPELREAIAGLLKSCPKERAFRIKRDTWMFGRKFKKSGTQFDYPIRLFLKDHAKFKQVIHEELIVDGEVGRLEEPLRHLTFQTVKEYARRLNQYTTLEVRHFGDKACPPPLLWGGRAVLRFLRCYIGWFGFLDGREGFRYAFLSGWYEWVKYSKIWENRHAGQ